MPQCRDCGVIQATAEMRRSKKEAGTWKCKDAARCLARQKNRKEKHANQNKQ